MLSRAFGLHGESGGQLRRLMQGALVGLSIGLLGGVLEGLDYNVHGGFGMMLVLLTYLACLAGLAICALGWVVARLSKQPSILWKEGLAGTIGTIVGLWGGLAVVLRFLGRL